MKIAEKILLFFEEEGSLRDGDAVPDLEKPQRRGGFTRRDAGRRQERESILQGAGYQVVRCEDKCLEETTASKMSVRG